MPQRAFPFTDDRMNVGENHNELIPTADSDRFNLSPPKDNLGERGFSKAALNLAERIVEAHNRNRPIEDRITSEDVPPGILRCFEAADAWPDANVVSMARAGLRSKTTAGGQLYYVEGWLNPLALCNDPTNGRTIVEARQSRLAHLEAVADDAPVELPVADVDSAAQLLELVAHAHDELGFAGTVDPGKDFGNLCSVGLQGVLDPILVVPVRYRDPQGNSMWSLVVVDGNRRLGMVLRVLVEATGLRLDELRAFAAHLRRPDGTTVLRDFDAAAVNAVRRRLALRDHAGGLWSPPRNAPEAVDEWLRGVAADSIAVRSVVRCRTVPAQIVVGFNPASLTSDVREEPSRAMAVVKRVVRRLHISEAATKDWSDASQCLQVVLEVLRAIHRRQQGAGGDFPLSLEEVDAVLRNQVPDWVGCPDGPVHPLRMTVKTLAMLVCHGHDAEEEVRSSMRAFGIPLRGVRAAEHRSKLAASVVMPMLGFRLNGGPYDRVRTVLDRTFRNRLLTGRPRPGQEWWRRLDLPVAGLVAGALVELAARPVGAIPAADGTTWHGPHTLALLALATTGQAASPAVALRSGGATIFQLTINGLGDGRGHNSQLDDCMTTPDQVMLRLCETEAGIRQLGEVVRAALAAEVPANTMDPEHVTGGDFSTRGWLTEAYLRGPAFFRPVQAPPVPGHMQLPNTPTSRYDALVTNIVGGIQEAWQHAQVLVTPPGDDAARELHTRFRDVGLVAGPDSPRPLTEMLEQLTRMAVLGTEFAAAHQACWQGPPRDEGEAA